MVLRMREIIDETKRQKKNVAAKNYTTAQTDKEDEEDGATEKLLHHRHPPCYARRV
jgi:hypothetical protein